ncbi:Fpg/Nei family DNA glycosylase [Microbacterium marinilacus]|uniref:DNA-(apurinic or apyrimidinic site) lyase n=1 Tax=Microbacterium marinilacus TaxID=415209 RepID=A0ABP7B2C3_9MICO|nr:DNA-formamidopyrimidine glycosylase family protein [Microbacterium marinilacus]MBY0688530.1 Fpg/Nei family DNA glycosylase [Microbacterium marinilacus]
MPEGHSVHRIARQFARNFVGRPISASSPQGRFAQGAAELDGRTPTRAQAVGKQMFLEFDEQVWLRVHLGLYGAWDFAGEILVDPTIASANGRMGQTNQRGTDLAAPGDAPVFDEDGENSLASIGAPRRTRVHVRMSEQTRTLGADGTADTEEPGTAEWPPPVVGQVRLRLMTDVTAADLRGPTACAVETPEQVDAVIARLGPDPLVGDPVENEERFVAAVRRRNVAIGQLLMDQAVVSGIGNVYRAEMLFRARLDPHTPGKAIPEELVRALWDDWVGLLRVGVETGQMMTMDDLSPDDWRRAMASRDDRHWVYHRAGLPCRVCGTEVVVEEMQARKLYWCPSCQR